MIHRMKKTCCLCFLMLLIVSCQTVITDIEIPYSPKLVIQCSIAPNDSIVQVVVGNNEPIIGTVGENRYVVKNATVTLSDSLKSQSVSTNYDQIQRQGLSVEGYFLKTKSLNLEAGKTYYLKVTAPNYPDTEAYCTIPKKSLVEKDIKVTISNTVESNVAKKTLTIQFNDFPNEENYYSTLAYSTEEYLSKNANGTKEKILLINKFGQEWFSDYRQNGASIVSSKTIFNERKVADSKYSVDVYVANTDKNYYQFYYEIVEKQRKSGGSDNPFLEPIPTFTNIKNGLGIFAGYNPTKVTVSL